MRHDKVKISDQFADWVEVYPGSVEPLVFVEAFQDQNDGEMAAECDFAFTPEAARSFAAALLDAAARAEEPS